MYFSLFDIYVLPWPVTNSQKHLHLWKDKCFHGMHQCIIIVHNRLFTHLKIAFGSVFINISCQP